MDHRKNPLNRTVPERYYRRPFPVRVPFPLRDPKQDQEQRFSSVILKAEVLLQYEQDLKNGLVEPDENYEKAIRMLGLVAVKQLKEQLENALKK